MCHVGFPTLLFNSEGISEMRQVRKGKKSGREAISRVEKSTTKWYQIVLICQVLPKFQGFEYWHVQLEITASLHLFDYDIKPNRSRQIIYCFSFTKLYQPRKETFVKLATKVSCSSTFEKFSFLSEPGKRTEIS